MSRKEKKTDAEDDGRVIARMNVDGMPWYAPQTPGTKPEDAERNAAELRKLSKGETFHMILGVLGAALTVAAVFAVGYLLFILFCRYVWFKV